MANWFEKLTDTAGTVLDTIQDVIDVVKHTDGPAVATPTTAPATTAPAAPAPAAPAPAAKSGMDQNSMLIVVAVGVLAVVILR